MDGKQEELIAALREAALAVHARWGSITTQYCTITAYADPVEVVVRRTGFERKLCVNAADDAQWVDAWSHTLSEKPTAAELISMAEVVRQHANYLSSQDWLGRLDRSIASMKSLTEAITNMPSDLEES